MCAAVTAEGPVQVLRERGDACACPPAQVLREFGKQELADEALEAYNELIQHGGI